ncbi:MAG: hypothetical protein J6Y02_06515 [Pseudobutyrivibrio sp.]|nr:hypothetical protein [Pseudobutyrivibrio sp.]
MNWIFLLIGLAIGLITGYFIFIIYLTSSLYGRMMVDRRNPDHFIFRLEFTQDPAEMPKRQRYIMMKVEETQLNSLQPDDLK